MDTNLTQADFHRFTRNPISLRKTQPALSRGATNSYHVDLPNRVLAFHRWVPGKGRDVVIVMSLSESTHTAYVLGFPASGPWIEILNSDYYDHFPNPWFQGNNGETMARPMAMHGLPSSAAITIPANTILVFSQTRKA